MAITSGDAGVFELVEVVIDQVAGQLIEDFHDFVGREQWYQRCNVEKLGNGADGNRCCCGAGSTGVILGSASESYSLEGQANGGW